MENVRNGLARYNGSDNWKIHDEEGLQALDAILYGPVKEVEEITYELEEEMIAEFKRLNPDFRYDYYEICTDD